MSHTPEELDARLRRPEDQGEYDGYAPDPLKVRAANVIRDLRVALASQIEITNAERVAKERAEALLVEQQSKSDCAPLDYEAMTRAYNEWLEKRPAGFNDRMFDAFVAGARWRTEVHKPRTFGAFQHCGGCRTPKLCLDGGCVGSRPQSSEDSNGESSAP